MKTTKTELIEENFDNFCKLITVSQKNALEQWLDINVEDPKVSEIKGNIKLLLYNKRNIPLKTRDTELTKLIDAGNAGNDQKNICQ